MRIKIICGCNAVLDFNEKVLSLDGTELRCSNCKAILPSDVSRNIKVMFSAYYSLSEAIKCAPANSVTLKSIKL